METRLKGRHWIMGDDYTIADIAHVGWVRNLIGFYGAGELVGIEKLSQCACLARTRAGAAGDAGRPEHPGAAGGMTVGPSRPAALAPRG